MKLIALASTVVALANAESVSPVQKVIQLLGELKTKVQNDLGNEGKAMDEYTKFCDDESKEKQYAIKTAASEIEGFEAVIESSTAKISEFEAALQSAGSDISAKQSELAGAKKVRADENADFKAAEKELVDTVDMLARAASVLKRELSFVQGGAKSKQAVLAKLGSMTSALSLVVDAAWVSSAASKSLKAFLDTDSDDDLSLVQQPQAVSRNYESKSGGIVATLNDMQDKAEDQLQQLRKEEMKSKFDFQMLEQSLTDSIKNLEQGVAEAKANKATTEQAKAKAEEDLAKTSEAKTADSKYLKNLQGECMNKAQEWDVRQKSAADEMAALDKAKEILGAGVKELFVQVSVKKTRVHSQDDSDARSELIKTLRKLGRKFNSFALMQMASQAGSDPFVKIRGMVEEMISKLEKQAEEEATHEAFCQEEMAKTKKARETKTASVDKHQTRIDQAKAGVSQLDQELAELEAQVVEIEKSTATATKIRHEENAEYKVASKDYKDSADAVTKAMEVLREFYGGASFVQQPSFGAAKSEGGNMIVSFLETAQSDFTRLLAESESDEAESSDAYEKLTQENKVSKASKEASIKGKTSEVKSLKVAIENSGADLSNSNEELDAVMDYLKELKPQCESKAMTYEERKERRDSEISGLKSALSILSGEEPALGGDAFVQRKVFLGRK